MDDSRLKAFTRKEGYLFISRIEWIADAAYAGLSGSSLTFRSEEAFLAAVNGLTTSSRLFQYNHAIPDDFVPVADETMT